MADKMQLVDWLDDLCVRFIINLPHEELQSVERICFQIEEAQWFYEDFIRPLDPSLPSMNLRRFSLLMFQHCPLSSSYSELHHTQAYEDFLAYKTRVPVRGAIMLNDDMTHAVLVKGWKKGAKWSFPRGKINKDESDLDCAVREVYEETGYDLKAAGLVEPDEQMKKIPVNMREQSMLLYVFRGVPMETHFEPRTRKEISKIDWYKLTDLPTLKKKHQAQGTGQDLVKDNSFYMVAPFLGPLKAWIKQQRRFDKQKAKTGATVAPPTAMGVTDTEEVDIGDTTADEAPIPDTQPGDSSFADLVAMLGRGHRSSDALPEVTVQPQTQQIIDPAAELKRLLSVGSVSTMQSPPAEAPGTVQQPQANPLLAILQSNNRPPPSTGPLPRTPFEQVLPTPPPPHSPHGQHRPHPPHLDQMPPPPPFPFPGQQTLPFRGPQHPHMPLQSHNSMPMHLPRQVIPPLPREGNPMFLTHAPNIQEAFTQQAPRPYQRTGDPQFAQAPQFPGVHGPAIPPASKLPPPKLNAHTLGLLNAFKMNEKPAPPLQHAQSQILQSSQVTPKMQQASTAPRPYDPYMSPQGLPSANPYAPSPPPFRSPPPNANFQPVQPKPRSAHQDSLLSLFRSPSVCAATPSPPQKSLAEPAELSALPTTPGNFKSRPANNEAGPPMPSMDVKPNLLELFQQPQKPGLTSATISGPVNAPDFDTVKKNAQISGVNGHSQSRGPSPSDRKSVEPKVFIPQQLLRREDTSQSLRSPTDVGGAAPETGANAPPATAFKRQILRRPQQNTSPSPAPTPTTQSQALLDIFKKQSSPPVAPAPPAQAPSAPGIQNAFDRRDTLPTDQKNALLSLFNKTSSSAGSPVPLTKSPLPKSPVPHTRSPRPPTPKTHRSGITSPVSPLPEKGSLQHSPADLASRSRISSIGETIPPNIIIPQNIPTSHPSTALSGTQKNGIEHLEEGYASAGSAGALGVRDQSGQKASTDGKSPVDKTFLLGFLEDVARRGR